jgi:hypothetical protein
LSFFLPLCRYIGRENLFLRTSFCEPLFSAAKKRAKKRAKNSKMSWDAGIKKLFTMWLMQIGKLRTEHCESSAKMNKYNDRITIVLVLLSGVASVGNFINLGSFSDKIKFWINLVSGALALLACIITSINKELKYGELASKHQIVAAEYHRISNLIQTASVSESTVDPKVIMENITNTVEMMERFSMPYTDSGAKMAELPNYMLIEQAIEKNRKRELKKSAEIVKTAKDDGLTDVIIMN